MSKNYKVLLLLLVLCNSSFSQLHKRHWIFGRPGSSVPSANVQLDFYPDNGNLYTDNSPIASNPLVNTTNQNGQEGWTIISNEVDGTLLFYTDGKFIYDHEHSPLLDNNGSIITLEGHQSSTRPAIVCPAGNNQFFIFTNPTGAAQTYQTGSLKYQVFNYLTKEISSPSELPGPYGSVLIGEGMTLIPNIENPNQFWLIARTHQADPTSSISGYSHRYLVYKIT